MPDALAERFCHLSLPDLLILIRPGVNLLHLSPCLCVFSYVILCGSHLFLSHSYTPTMLWPTYLVTLGNCSYDFIRHSYGRFFLKTLADFCFRIKDSSPPVVWPGIGPDGTSRNSPWKSEVAERRRFFKRIAGTFFCCFQILVMIFFCGLCPPIWNGETSSSDFFTVFFRWLVRDWISKTTSPLHRLHDHFHANIPFEILVVETITKKIHQFNGTTLNPSKTTM